MHLAQLDITSPSTIFTTDKSSTLPELFVSRFLLFAIAFAGFFFFFRIIVSGYLYLTSMGDPGKVQASSKNLINSILGLVIVLGAFLIAQIIFAILGLNTPLSIGGPGGPSGR